MRNAGGLVALAIAVALGVLVSDDDASRAQELPSGWIPLGQVSIDKRGCVSCPATFDVSGIHRSFGLGTDSPYPISLAGQLTVTCRDGTSYEMFLRPSTRGGLFQISPNLCVNLDATRVGLKITTASLSPPDAQRTVVLTVYGRAA